MEGDIRKQGMLYLQQQRFGKKWKRVWCVLYRESSCSISRLEFFECKDGGTVEKSDKSLRKQQEHKKVIRLADCIRVSEVDMEGCPRDTGPFLVETTEKIYVFAADRQQVDDWTHRLYELDGGGGEARQPTQREQVEEDEGMEDNSLYSGRETVRDFRVCVRRTEASDRCRLKGDVVLRADVDALHLLDKTGDVVFTWPYKFLRRFGRDKSTFSFEAGRRCDSGEGSFEFDTKQGNFLFQATDLGGGQASPEIPHNLSLPPLPLSQSRTPQPRGHIPQPPAAEAADGVYSMARLEPPGDKVLTGVKSLNLDTRGGSTPRKNQVKMISSCPLPHADPGPAPTASSSPAHSSRLSPNLSSNPTPDQMYSQITLPGERGTVRERKERGTSLAPPPQITPPDPEYSLPSTLSTRASWPTS
ncbi:hypothetical protein INR49_021205 [Caranx melampygus]|nr:hypothetical protein INR49_021205 [Caranx melampygus]